jgi:hypothetical protein
MRSGPLPVDKSFVNAITLFHVPSAGSERLSRRVVRDVILGDGPSGGGDRITRRVLIYCDSRRSISSKRPLESSNWIGTSKGANHRILGIEENKRELLVSPPSLSHLLARQKTRFTAPELSERRGIKLAASSL